MPIFWPRLWHSVIAIELTFPNWNRYGGIESLVWDDTVPEQENISLTSLIPPPLIREHTPPVKAVPLRPLWNVRPLKHRMPSNQNWKNEFHPNSFVFSAQISPPYEKSWTTSLCSLMLSFLYFMKFCRVITGSSTTGIIFLEVQVSMATSTILVFSCSL